MSPSPGRIHVLIRMMQTKGNVLQALAGHVALFWNVSVSLCAELSLASTGGVGGPETQLLPRLGGGGGGEMGSATQRDVPPLKGSHDFQRGRCG